MKDQTLGVAIEKFASLKAKTYLFLVDNNEHKKQKCVNRNIVATISRNKYKDALLSNKCITHSMNRTQSKKSRIGAYEINKVSFSYFYAKIYIQNIGYGGLALG